MNEAGKVIDIPIEDILPNRFQPRIKFAETEVLALSDSIKKHGVIQPILVRPIGDKYEIIAGERRYKASEMAGKATIPAIIKELDDQKSAELALIENVQRKDLTPTEEALSYKKILDMGYLTQDQLAEKLGKKQSTIANKLRLLNLDEDVQNALLYEKISERHARALLKLDKDEQKNMLERIMKERLTVRQTDIEIEKILSQQKLVEQPKVEEEIEVLDFPEEELMKTMDETKEKPNMNEKEYNLPTSTIQDDIPEETVISIPSPVMPEVNPIQVPTPSQESLIQPENITPPEAMNSIIDEPVSFVADNPINPGFMDVDKIVETAKDINRPTQKDKKEIDELLKPDEQILKMQEAEKEANKEAEAILKPGKFFNLADIEDDSEEGANGFVENIDKEQANMDFGVKKAPSPSTGFNFDKFFNPNEFEKTLEPTEPTVQNTISEEQEPNQVTIQTEKNQEELSTVEPENVTISQETVLPEQPVIPPAEEILETPPMDVENNTFISNDVEIKPEVDSMISPEIVIPKEEEVLPEPQDITVDENHTNPYLNMSEEDFLNSLPDNDLPLSSLATEQTEESPYIPEEPKVEVPMESDAKTFEPEFDFTTLEPISESVSQSESFVDPEISTEEPIIKEDGNSFLFEPLEEEVAPLIEVESAAPTDSFVEPVVVPPIAKEYKTEVPEPIITESSEVPVFQVEKVSDEVTSFVTTLEQKGYQVRIEEYDFEDLYQVVLKVKKENQ